MSPRWESCNRYDDGHRAFFQRQVLMPKHASDSTALLLQRQRRGWYICQVQPPHCVERGTLAEFARVCHQHQHLLPACIHLCIELCESILGRTHAERGICIVALALEQGKHCLVPTLTAYEN